LDQWLCAINPKPILAARVPGSGHNQQKTPCCSLTQGKDARKVSGGKEPIAPGWIGHLDITSPVHAADQGEMWLSIRLNIRDGRYAQALQCFCSQTYTLRAKPIVARKIGEDGK